MIWFQDPVEFKRTQKNIRLLAQNLTQSLVSNLLLYIISYYVLVVIITCELCYFLQNSMLKYKDYVWLHGVATENNFIYYYFSGKWAPNEVTHFL